MFHRLHHSYLVPIILPLFPTHRTFTDRHGIGMILPSAAEISRAKGGAVAEVLVFTAGRGERVPLVAAGGGVVVSAAHDGGDGGG